MKLEQLLALLRGAQTPEARAAILAGLTPAQRQSLNTAAFARATELNAIESRTDEQSAELLLCLDAAESLDAACREDAAITNRVQALAGSSSRTANPAVTASQTRTDPDAGTQPGAIAQEPAMLRIGTLDMGGALARSITSDLTARGLQDSQIRHLASPEYRNEFMTWIRSCAGNPYGETTRALNEVTIDGGGAVVPPDFLAEIIQRRRAKGGITTMVRRFQTSRDEVRIPKMNMGSSTQINDLTEQWPGAEGTVTEDTTLEQFGSVTIKMHRGGLLIIADRAWLEDSAMDMEQWIVEQIADVYESRMRNVIINGSGNGRPFGLVTRTGTTTAADNLITAVNIGDPVDPTGLMNIIGNLDEQYAENAQWLIKRSVLFSQIISLRDSAGGFLFGTNSNTDGGTQKRIESQLLGYPVEQTDFMAAAGAGNKIAFFGDFREGYGFVERTTLQIEPYVDPAIQKKDQRGWYVRFRVGGDVLADWALRCGLNTDV